MKLKDSTVISLLAFTWILIAIGVIGADSEIARIEEKIDTLYNAQNDTLQAIDEIEQANLRQDERMDEIERYNRVQDFRLALHSQALEDSTSMFTDMIDNQIRLEEYCRSLPDNAWGIEITEDEEYLVASLVYLEAGGQGCSYELKKAIATVFFNQMVHYGTSVRGTIYRAGAFSVSSRVASTTPSPSCRMAVREVLDNGGIFPRNVLAFQTGGYHRFGHAYTKIQNVYFNTM